MNIFDYLQYVSNISLQLNINVTLVRTLKRTKRIIEHDTTFFEIEFVDSIFNTLKRL